MTSIGEKIVGLGFISALAFVGFQLFRPKQQQPGVFLVNDDGSTTDGFPFDFGGIDFGGAFSNLFESDLEPTQFFTPPTQSFGGFGSANSFFDPFSGSIFGPTAATTTGTPDFERLVNSVIKEESNGDPNAIGPRLSNGENALGLMQIRPSTAASPGFGVQSVPPDTLFDPIVNRIFGSEYLQAMLDRYGNVPDALSGYNFGPGNTDKWIANGRVQSELPAQTRNYIRSIQSRL